MLAITHYDPNTLYILRFSGEVDIRIRSSHFKGIIKNKYFSAGESSFVVSIHLDEKVSSAFKMDF